MEQQAVNGQQGAERQQLPQGNEANHALDFQQNLQEPPQGIGGIQAPNQLAPAAALHNLQELLPGIEAAQALGIIAPLAAALAAALQGQVEPAPQNPPPPVDGNDANGGPAPLPAAPQYQVPVLVGGNNNVVAGPAAMPARGANQKIKNNKRGVRAGRKVQARKDQHTKELANLLGYLAAVPRIQNSGYRGRGGYRANRNNRPPWAGQNNNHMLQDQDAAPQPQVGANQANAHQISNHHHLMQQAQGAAQVQPPAQVGANQAAANEDVADPVGGAAL